MKRHGYPSRYRVGALPVVAGLVAWLPRSAAASDQLEIVPDPALLVILIVIFAALIYPLNALLFRPIFKVLDERDARITGARERAAGLTTQADEILGRYETAVRSAREEAETARRAQLDEARHEQMRLTTTERALAESEMTRASEDLETALEGARGALRRESEELARIAAERILGRELS